MRLLERLVDRLRAAAAAPDGVAPPVAILWPDPDGQWLPLLAALRATHPWVYTLGRYDPATKTGPSIWLKCIVGRTLPEAPPKGETPILYLPHVRRQDLRAAADCPAHLQPLVELQYRGRVWHQPNGQDWTVRAFLVAEEGLGLEVASDRRTEEAMLRALPLLAETDAETLRGRRLEADDFDKLAIADPVRDVLMWLHDTEKFEALARGPRWESFRSVCQSEFGFDPEKISPAEVAGALLRGERRLDRVWERFLEAPRAYAGLANLLARAELAGNLPLVPERNPRINEDEERALREELERLTRLPHGQACARLLELEIKHGDRRSWVWARLGLSPWATALEPLARLARAGQRPVGGASLAAAAAAYAQEGWECDAAAMEALALFQIGADADLIARVVRTIYEPWLETSARHFQNLIAAEPQSVLQLAADTPAEEGTCVLFVDGLRFDVARQLAALLEARTLRVTLNYRLAALPTVTATGKPAVAPVKPGIHGGESDDFTPHVESKSGRKPLTSALLRELLKNANIEVCEPGETRIASNAPGGGWAECSSIDNLGHGLGLDLVRQLNTESNRIAETIVTLLNAGWRRVRVITDHGWLLLPGDLPKVELPAYLVETKWARCALVRGEPDLSVPTACWRWDPEVRFASPPGIACFRAGETYAHGGLSPQECVIPELLVERGLEAVFASIQSVEWRGMRCRVRVEASDPQVKVDLRTNWRQASSSIVAAVKEVGTEGEVSLVVADDAHEGAAAFVVVLDAEDRVIVTQTTCVGGRS